MTARFSQQWVISPLHHLFSTYVVQVCTNCGHMMLGQSRQGPHSHGAYSQMGKRHVNQTSTHINVMQCDKCEESGYLVQWEHCWKIWPHWGQLGLPKEVRMVPRFGDQSPEPQGQAEGRNRILSNWGLTSFSISTLRNFTFIISVIEAKDSEVTIKLRTFLNI